MSSTRRSIVLDGKVTSIKLEKAFWDFLDQSAWEAEVTWADYIRELLDEIGHTQNRAGSVKEALLDLAIQGKASQDAEVHALGSMRQWEITWKEIKDLMTLPHGVLRLGRSPLCEIRLHDPDCSRLHAAVFPVGTEWWVTDLESKNGVWIEGERVERSRLRPGTIVNVGDTEVRLLT